MFHLVRNFRRWLDHNIDGLALAVCYTRDKVTTLSYTSISVAYIVLKKTFNFVSGVKLLKERVRNPDFEPQKKALASTILFTRLINLYKTDHIYT